MASETGEGKEETVEVQEPEEVPQTEEKAEDNTVLKKPASKQSKAEAKAKAKAKAIAAKAKAKAKTKEKTKAKTKGKGLAGSKEKKKKKETKETKETQKKEVLKRPAAKGFSMREQLSQLQSGVPHEEKEDQPEGEEEEVKEDDAVVDPENEKRSKGAGGKMSRLLKAGKVPQQIKEIWQKCETREEKTMLVNRLFKKNPETGCWEMQAENPSFKTWLKTSDKSYGKDAQQSFPRAIMLHHYFRGDENAFQHALATGDIMEITKGGKVMYSFECYESGRAKEADQRMDLERGSSKLSVAEHDVVSNVLSNFDWTKFGQEAQPEARTTSKGTLALTNGPQVVLWKNVEPLLTQAKSAHDRVLGSLNKMFAAVANSKDKDTSGKFKLALTTLQTNSQDISNALMFQVWLAFAHSNICKPFLLLMCFQFPTCRRYQAART